MVPNTTSAGRSGRHEVEYYHSFERRRRLAMLATGLTTVVLMAIGIAVALWAKELVPSGSSPGGPSEEGGLLTWLRVALFLFVVNPLVLAGVCVVAGLLSYRLWFRAITGERAVVEASALDLLGGRASRR
ncbi:MAG: hypothetical protein HY332_05500 [Chloroflexi bacterium]|nr:hypothetical protein [Chloroflexota bacterium]